MRILIILSILALTGCSTSSQSSPTPAPETETLHQEVSALQDRLETLEETLAKKEADLKSAQEEIRWLHRHIVVEPSRYAPRDVVERYGAALIERNGAVARLYLAEPLHSQMPARGIGISNPVLKRVEVLDEQGIDESTYQFKVQMFSEYTWSPEEVSELSRIFTVEKLKNDTGNEVWLITDIAK